MTRIPIKRIREYERYFNERAARCQRLASAFTMPTCEQAKWQYEATQSAELAKCLRRLAFHEMKDAHDVRVATYCCEKCRQGKPPEGGCPFYGEPNGCNHPEGGYDVEQKKQLEW